MRTLLRDFADRGGAVLLSSHLLHEVQATVDHLVVISGGAVVAAGAMQDLLASSGLIVRSPDAAALQRMLAGIRSRATSTAGAAVSSVGDWIDTGKTFNWVLAGDWGGHLPNILVSVGLWLVLPLTLGLIRTARREIK